MASIRRIVRILVIVGLVSLAISGIAVHLHEHRNVGDLVPVTHTTHAMGNDTNVVHRFDRFVRSTSLTSLSDRVSNISGGLRVAMGNYTWGGVNVSVTPLLKESSISAFNNSAIRWGPVGLRALGLVCIAIAVSIYLWATFWKLPEVHEIWEDIALQDLDLGDPDRNVLPLADALPRVAEMANDALRVPHWREQLFTFMEQIGLPRALLARHRMRLDRLNSRRHAAQALMRDRDDVFRVRNQILMSVPRESVGEHTAINRIVVGRQVDTTFRQLNISPYRASQLREAVINAYFIDTIYDAAGKEIALGPARRPL